MDGVSDRGWFEERREGQRIERGIGEAETEPGSIDRQDGPGAGRPDGIAASVAAVIASISAAGAATITVVHGVLRRLDIIAARRCVIQVGRARRPSDEERERQEDRDESGHRGRMLPTFRFGRKHSQREIQGMPRTAEPYGGIFGGSHRNGTARVSCVSMS